jgi:hypothetical protein
MHHYSHKEQKLHVVVLPGAENASDIEEDFPKIRHANKFGATVGWSFVL